MKQQATPQQLKSMECYQKNLIKLLNMPEDKHIKTIVQDGACPRMTKARIQNIRSHLTHELRTIERWKKNKPLN
jgi:hypothetical protein